MNKPLLFTFAFAITACAANAAPRKQGGAPVASPAPGAPNFVVSISEINQSFLQNEVTIQGKVMAFTPPRTEKAPYSFLLKDNTGNLRIAAWKDVWEKIPFNAQIQPGADVTVKAKISSFQGNLEGHIDVPENIKMGLVNPKAMTATPAAAGGLPAGSNVSAAGTAVAGRVAEPIRWRNDIPLAMQEAAKAGKKILVFFYAPDSENSRYIDKNVFTDARVAGAVSQKYIPVMVNMAQQSDIATKLQVFRGGVVVIYNADGTSVKQIAIIHTADDVLKEIQ